MRAKRPWEFVCIVTMICAIATPAVAQSTGLQGQYGGSAQSVCVNSSNGFDQNLQPIDPKDSWTTLRSAIGTFDFTTTSQGSESDTEMSNSEPAKVTSRQSPIISQEQTSGSFTYTIGSNNSITITTTNLQGTILAGPNTGGTFTVDRIQLAGFVSADGTTITLATTSPGVETVTSSGGNSHQRICHRSATFAALPNTTTPK